MLSTFIVALIYNSIWYNGEFIDPGPTYNFFDPIFRILHRYFGKAGVISFLIIGVVFFAYKLKKHWKSVE